MRDLRKSAAASDKNFEGAGQKVGLEIWRVENRRTKADTPDFGVKRWPKEDYGSFYSGDSYLALNTYQVVDPETKKLTDKLAWDVHFWLGKDSSQDEIGVAAYKAVELDDLLDDGPVQHRETQGNESALFQSYFKGIQYMEGGIASGFRHVKPEEYTPRMFQVRRTAKTIRAGEVPVDIKSMNDGDVFILDAGLKVYQFIGTTANAFEKMKGGAMASNIVSARQGKAKFFPEFDDDAWKLVKGSLKQVPPAQEDKPDPPPEKVDADKLVLFRLSDASGKMQFTKVAEGKINASMFDSAFSGACARARVCVCVWACSTDAVSCKANDVFILDGGVQVFVWVGKGASKNEKSQCMKYATGQFFFTSDCGCPRARARAPTRMLPLTRPMCRLLGQGGQAVDYPHHAHSRGPGAPRVRVPCARRWSRADAPFRFAGLVKW